MSLHSPLLDGSLKQHRRRSRHPYRRTSAADRLHYLFRGSLRVVPPRRSMPSSPHRFPPPWTIEELDACFVVIDSAGQKAGLRLLRGRASARSSDQVDDEG